MIAFELFSVFGKSLNFARVRKGLLKNINTKLNIKEAIANFLRLLAFFNKNLAGAF
jgi:hypothetical protein